MRIAHYYAQGLHHPSGVTAAISLWAQKLVKQGHKVALLTAPGLPELEAPYGIPIKQIPHWGAGRASLVPEPRALAAAARSFDVTVFHEGWTLSHYAAARALSRSNQRFISMPHGVYEPDITAQLKGPAKVRHAAEYHYLRKAAGVHVFFDSEAELIRDQFPDVPVLVQPTGFDRDPEVHGRVVPPRNYVLWFGRIDVFHKGLDILVDALGLLPPGDRPQLRIAGYDHNGGVSRLRRVVASAGVTDFVSIEGPLDAIGKQAALAGALAYVHPSRWECHSIAFLEAMASGTPVYVGSGSRIASLVSSTRAATVIAGTPDAWAQALRESALLRHDNVDRQRFFRALDWDSVIQDTVGDYKGLLSRS